MADTSFLCLTLASLQKRGTIGRWYGRGRAEAIADADNKGTTDSVLFVASDQLQGVY